ncbi:MAG: cell division protein ZapA [Spirochaetia bacterium]
MRENRYTIELLGASISIRTEEDLIYIKKLVQNVESTIQDIKISLGLRDPLSVAIMAAVFLSDENMRLKNRQYDANVPGPSFSVSEPQIVPEYDEYDKASDVLSQLGDLLDRTLRRS